MDDDIFSVVNVQPVQTNPHPPPQPAPKGDIFDMGISFETTTPPPQRPPQQVSNDPFNILGLDVGGTKQPLAPPPINNGGFGGDLLGFGISSTPPQPVSQPPANNLLGGGDLMGFGFGSNPSPPVNTGFNFGQTNPPTFNPQPQPPQNNLGFNLLGS